MEFVVTGRVFQKRRLCPSRLLGLENTRGRERFR
jgi:hypothetical protein